MGLAKRGGGGDPDVAGRIALALPGRVDRPFDVVVVHSDSRFFRDACGLEMDLRRLAKAGVLVVSIAQELGDRSVKQPVPALICHRVWQPMIGPLLSESRSPACDPDRAVAGSTGCVSLRTGLTFHPQSEDQNRVM